MIGDTSAYNTAKIRELLTEAFTAEELRRFCQDRPSFRPVVAKFGPGQGLSDMVDRVIDYCRTRLLWDDLLAAVKEENPRQYARFEYAFPRLFAVDSLHACPIEFVTILAAKNPGDTLGLHEAAWHAERRFGYHNPALFPTFLRQYRS